MQFSQTTSPFQGIIQNIERESGLGLGAVSDNASPNYLLAYFLGKVNEWNHIVNCWIHEINDEITFDDINNTGDIPEEYSFTVNVQIYDLDSDITKIRKVEARDAVSLKWYTLKYYYESDRIENLYGQDKEMPSKYFIKNRKLVTDVPVNITKADKYRLTYDRHSHEFEISDTTAVPGFDKQFHWILVYASTMDWAIGKYPDVFDKCRLKVFGAGEGDPNAFKTLLQDHYLKQNRDMKYKISRKTKSYD